MMAVHSLHLPNLQVRGRGMEEGSGGEGGIRCQWPEISQEKL